MLSSIVIPESSITLRKTLITSGSLLSINASMAIRVYESSTKGHRLPVTKVVQHRDQSHNANQGQTMDIPQIGFAIAARPIPHTKSRSFFPQPELLPQSEFPPSHCFLQLTEWRG